MKNKYQQIFDNVVTIITFKHRMNGSKFVECKIKFDQPARDDRTKFKSLYENNSLMNLIVNRSVKNLKVNRNGAKVSGYKVNELACQSVKKDFLKEICNLTFATSGEEALIAVEKEKFAAILMDINLDTGMSSTQAVGKIKQFDEYKVTPIVAITAFAMKGDKDEYLKAGCTH